MLLEVAGWAVNLVERNPTVFGAQRLSVKPTVKLVNYFHIV
jgi:hypothetical protein